MIKTNNADISKGATVTSCIKLLVAGYDQSPKYRKGKYLSCDPTDKKIATINKLVLVSSEMNGNVQKRYHG